MNLQTHLLPLLKIKYWLKCGHMRLWLVSSDEQAVTKWSEPRNSSPILGWDPWGASVSQPGDIKETTCDVVILNIYIKADTGLVWNLLKVWVHSKSVSTSRHRGVKVSARLSLMNLHQWETFWTPAFRWTSASLCPQVWMCETSMNEVYRSFLDDRKWLFRHVWSRLHMFIGSLASLTAGTLSCANFGLFGGY